VAEEVVSAILERISERVEGGAEEGMRVRLRHAMQGQGVFVCFCCAAPVVREKRRKGGGLAARGGQPPQQASASRAGLHLRVGLPRHGLCHKGHETAR